MRILLGIALVACTPALADDLHIVRYNRIESFSGCVTTRLYMHGNQGHLTMYCPTAPAIRKKRPGLPKPGNSVSWDWYVSDATNVRMGEGCSLRAHFAAAYGNAITELECPGVTP